MPLRFDELLIATAALTSADRQHLIAELARRYSIPGAGGRPSLTKTARAAVAMAKRLAARGLSLKRISAKLAEAGRVNERGQPCGAQSVRAMLQGPQKRKPRRRPDRVV